MGFAFERTNSSSVAMESINENRAAAARELMRMLMMVMAMAIIRRRRCLSESAPNRPRNRPKANLFRRLTPSGSRELATAAQLQSHTQVTAHKLCSRLPNSTAVGYVFHSLQCGAGGKAARTVIRWFVRSLVRALVRSLARSLASPFVHSSSCASLDSLKRKLKWQLQHEQRFIIRLT